MNKKILAVLGLGLVLRLIGLNQSLWLDEAVSARVVGEDNGINIVKNFSPSDFHPPLYYLLLWGWTRIFGVSEISLRMPSVILAMVTIYLVYLIGKEIKDEELGRRGALLTAVNPLLVYYSQEARMYSLAVVWLTAAWLFLIRKKYWLFNLSCFGAMMTFYGSIFFIIAMAVWNGSRKEIGKRLIGLVLALVILGPLIGKQWQGARSSLVEVANWSAALGRVNIKNLLLIPVKFFIGRISFYPKILYWLIAAMWTIIAGTGIIRGIKKKRSLAVLLMVPILLGCLVSIGSPMMAYFRFLYLIPVATIILALGNGGKLTLGFLVFSFLYGFNSNFHREDWRSLVSSLKSDERIYIIPTVTDPIRYYNKGLGLNDLKNGEITGKVITVIPYAAAIHGIDYQKRLDSLGYKKIEEISFREQKIERWQLN